MAKKQGAKEWLDKMLGAEPGGEEWDSIVKDLHRRFPGLIAEDQVKVAERLAALSASEGVPELIEKAYNAKGASLAAMIVLGGTLLDLGKIEAGLIPKMEKWALMCEGDEAECDPRQFFDLPDKEQAAVLDHLVLWLRADIISGLKEAVPDKKKAKLLARALHRVKSAGAEVAMEGEARFVMPRAESDEYHDEAYVSPPDHSGTLFIYLYRTVFGKHSLFVVLINDLSGVIRFEGYDVSKKQFDKMLESTRKNPHAIIVKADPGWVRLLIRRAEEAGRKLGKSQNQDYLRNRRAIGAADQPEAPHPIWTHFDREELKKERGLLYRADELLEHRMFEDWRLMPLEEGKFFVELEDMKHGLLELSEQQKKERENLLFEKEVNRILDHQGRETWRDRLLNCAYVLHRLGDQEQARIAAAVALALENKDDPPPAFLVELLRRTVEEATKEKDDDDGKKGPDMDRGGIVLA
jgi:hypothetical protein